eukprot:3354257-Amphidinium_carterae.1
MPSKPLTCSNVSGEAWSRSRLADNCYKMAPFKLHELREDLGVGHDTHKRIAASTNRCAVVAAAPA